MHIVDHRHPGAVVEFHPGGARGFAQRFIKNVGQGQVLAQPLLSIDMGQVEMQPHKTAVLRRLRQPMQSLFDAQAAPNAIGPEHKAAD